ncbi:uncharacterized protein MYCFIDRAFT_170542 [Pseudocercospora fijiensis CIRAD86]|uniref:Uncharacterized protein n=1 Tax=Pseudocercospora fijiensis (strain CIRAD86) TaxID=383855 RepID=N1Q854_PSEFD|nr:uncharacterized protein MYCFIDRAFT_170542 [Pseudocercospora fijiensis CIRAD86]EME89004.1 hypothetical protein MYCFIDRAFT_170542 [Pseudocercospora fijiensis CIRAD86]
MRPTTAHWARGDLHSSTVRQTLARKLSHWQIPLGRASQLGRISMTPFPVCARMSSDRKLRRRVQTSKTRKIAMINCKGRAGQRQSDLMHRQFDNQSVSTHVWLDVSFVIPFVLCVTFGRQLFVRASVRLLSKYSRVQQGGPMYILGIIPRTVYVRLFFRSVRITCIRQGPIIKISKYPTFRSQIEKLGLPIHNLQPRFTDFVIALHMLHCTVVAPSKSNRLKQTATSLGIWEPTSGYCNIDVVSKNRIIMIIVVIEEHFESEP